MIDFVVTGASGFIGGRLVPRLLGAGYRVHAVDTSVGDVAEASTWSELPPARVVVHLAARSFVPDSWMVPAEYLRTNVMGTVGALDYCRRHGARLVFLSSYLYGAPARLPIDEGAPLEARNPYALSKQLAEETCRFYANEFGVDVTVLRPFNVYGPGQREPFLVPFLARQLSEGQVIRVKDLEPRRDYVYVDDVIEGIVSAAERASGFHVFNLGSGRSHSVAEVIALLQEIGGTTLPVESESVRRPGEIMDTVADIGAARRMLDWSPAYDLRTGLREVWEATRRASV